MSTEENKTPGEEVEKQASPTPGKTVYTFARPVVINGVQKNSVEYRALTVGDMRKVNKGKTSNQTVRMIAFACGIAPTDVEEFKTRDFVALRSLIVDDLEEGAEIDYEPDDNEEIPVELSSPIKTEEGKTIKSVIVVELTTKQSLKAEKIAKGDDFETVFHRVRESCGLSSADLEKMTLEDFNKVGAAVSVFFTQNGKN